MNFFFKKAQKKKFIINQNILQIYIQIKKQKFYFLFLLFIKKKNYALDMENNYINNNFNNLIKLNSL